MKIPLWMRTEKVMVFRVFVADKDDRDERKIRDFDGRGDFEIDVAVFFDGESWFIFSDMAMPSVSKIHPRSRKQLGAWLATLDEDTILMGYNSSKRDYQLLQKQHDISFKTIDLMDTVGLAMSDHFEDTPKVRVDLKQCARWNRLPIYTIPHLSWLLSSMEMFSDWAYGAFRDVTRNLCAECEVIAKLGYRIRRRGAVRIADPVSGKGISLDIDFHAHVLPKGFFTSDPAIQTTVLSEDE